MSDFFPILVAIIVVIANGILAAKRGTVSLFASGLATLVALVVCSIGFQWIPSAAETYLDLELEWVPVAIVTGSLAVFLYFLVRILSVVALRRLFGPDSPLHFLSKGFGGAVASILPSLVVIVFLFTCFRIAGTLQELNYVASLSREGITNMGGKIPPYPVSGRWRDQIEKLPAIADGLDRIDPFSRRAARNAAALVIANEAPPTRSFLRDHSATATLATDDALDGIARKPGVSRALAANDQVSLVLQPVFQELARDSRLSGPLQRLHLRPALEDFVDSIEPLEPRETPPPTE